MNKTIGSEAPEFCPHYLAVMKRHSQKHWINFRSQQTHKLFPKRRQSWGGGRHFSVLVFGPHFLIFESPSINSNGIETHYVQESTLDAVGGFFFLVLVCVCGFLFVFTIVLSIESSAPRTAPDTREAFSNY